MSRTVTCVSGLSLLATKFKIKHRRLLTSRELQRSGMLFVRMLAAVSEQVIAPGPYPFQPGNKPDWTRVSLGDIMDAVLQIRSWKLDTIDARKPCKNCEKPVGGEIRISELTRVIPSQEGLEHLSKPDTVLEEKLTVETDDGQVVKFPVQLKILRGHDNPTITKWSAAGDAEAADATICLQIASIHPPGYEKPLTRFEDIYDWYGDQDWGVDQQLDDLVTKHGGGVRTLTEDVCESCNMVNTIRFPFGESFFFPQEPRSSSVK